jgi:hypothetical protein
MPVLVKYCVAAVRKFVCPINVTEAHHTNIKARHTNINAGNKKHGCQQQTLTPLPQQLQANLPHFSAAN